MSRSVRGLGERHGFIPMLAAGEAEAHFGPLATWVAGSGPASSEWTRTTLGWEPHELGLIADIDRSEYYA